MIDTRKMELWLENGWNVLFKGRHGVGKSSAIIDLFDRKKIKWAYYSGATMDPFLDFLGIPVPGDNGQVKMLLPPHVDPDVEVIFIDEYNRAHPRIRNAVMELIQFGTVNRIRRFPNLKAVWAAVNPSEDEESGDVYDVESLDPAQADRFHIQINIPFAVDEKYFIEKFGDVGRSACEFWNSLPKKDRNLCSPRRLEYALDVFKSNGDIADVLDERVHPKRLKDLLHEGPTEALVAQMYETKDYEGARSFFADDNKFAIGREIIINNPDYLGFFLPLLPKERFTIVFGEDAPVRRFVHQMVKKEGEKSLLIDPLREIVKAEANTASSKMAKKILTENSIPLEDKKKLLSGV